MTNKELRAKIYNWLYECYQVKISDQKEKENKKKLKKILDEYNPTQDIPQPQLKKEYINTSNKIKVWRNF